MRDKKKYPQLSEKQERGELHEMIKKRGPNNCHYVITQEEWEKYETLGYDMSKFITIQELKKQHRARQLEEIKSRTK